MNKPSQCVKQWKQAIMLSKQPVPLYFGHK